MPITPTTDIPSPSDSDVIPESEMARRRRVLQLGEDIGDLVVDAFDRIHEFMEITDTRDVVEVLGGRILDARAKIPKDKIDFVMGKIRELAISNPDLVPSMMEGYSFGANFLGPALAAKGRRNPLADVFERLFDEAPKMTDAAGNPVPDQAPAHPQLALNLKSGYQMQGAVSGDPDGMLKLMVPAEVPGVTGGSKIPAMLEYFVHVDDVETVAVVRPIATSQRSSIFTGSS